MATKNTQINWQFIDVNEFSAEHLKHFSVRDIRKMFLRTAKPMVPELAYLSFLQHSMWGVEFDFERGIEKVMLQLNLPLFEGTGLSWKHTYVNPHKIWATEDSLDLDIYQMIETGIQYMDNTKKPVPPVIIWLIKDDGRYNYVCHDGHHRIRYFAQRVDRMPAVVLEYWIDNRANPLLAQKLHYQKIDTHVIDLPIVQRDF